MEYIILKKSNFEDWIEQFCNLYTKCFSGTITEEIVRWRYLENPVNEVLVCIAVDNGKLVGNYAVLPCELVIDNNVYRSAISTNSMIDPEYRGRGLLVDLAKKLYCDLEKRNYKTIVGFPNHISNPLFVKKLNRKQIYEVPTLELEISKSINDLKFAVTIEDDSKFILEYNHSNPENRNIYLKKTRTYLKWRYFSNPSNIYTNYVIKDTFNSASSYIIFKEYNDKLNIVDWYFKNDFEFEALLNKVIKYASSLNKISLTTWALLGSREHMLFQEWGFRNNYPITFFSAMTFGNINKISDIYDYRNWSIKMGDNHVY